MYAGDTAIVICPWFSKESLWTTIRRSKIIWHSVVNPPMWPFTCGCDNLVDASWSALLFSFSLLRHAWDRSARVDAPCWWFRSCFPCSSSCHSFVYKNHIIIIIDRAWQQTTTETTYNEESIAKSEFLELLIWNSMRARDERLSFIHVHIGLWSNLFLGNVNGSNLNCQIERILF